MGYPETALLCALCVLGVRVAEGGIDRITQSAPRSPRGPKNIRSRTLFFPLQVLGSRRSLVPGARACGDSVMPQACLCVLGVRRCRGVERSHHAKRAKIAKVRNGVSGSCPSLRSWRSWRETGACITRSAFASLAVTRCTIPPEGTLSRGPSRGNPRKERRP
jgi:hypothetical protein